MNARREDARPSAASPSPTVAREATPRTDVSISLRKLVLIRWVAVIGQAATLLVIHYGLGYRLPIESAFAVVAASAVLNAAASLPRSAGARLGDREAALYLAYDTLQLGLLLYLTGGLQNPFAMLMLAPVTVSATILSRSSVIGLSALTVAAISALAIFHLPLPARAGTFFDPPPLYMLGIWTALVCSTIFIAGYAWSVAAEARRMRDAFSATQLALAREQRISAVGSLAAAAAHQLGSPLATIAVIAKELVRDLPTGSPHTADAELLLSQSERCRTILTDLARQREGEHGSPFARLPFSALVEAAGEPYVVPGIAMHYEIGASRDAAGHPIEEPLVPRSPEIMHGLGNLIQNAIQFAAHEVVVTTSWSEEVVAVDIVDDGPGFPPAVLSRIGEPYLSGRGPSVAGIGAQHMGLGIFIAQSLLERTGAKLSFANLADGGAQVVIEWRRQRIAALEPTTPLREAGE
ncbi:MAG TPA: ActS/PrrB/RegB family redox-sensitive histidine kinase [Stellaceae bacterium]|nr:ActS/PrrB/RegB family redox-sensitive histidine kinase [Stellaceae bacterium]